MSGERSPHRRYFIRVLLMPLLLYCACGGALAQTTPQQQLAQWLGGLDIGQAHRDAGDLVFPEAHVRFQDCGDYPYHASNPDAERQLAQDLAAGLRQGVACLAGSGPAGDLGPYHRQQARRLLQLLATARTKTFRCVADRMFANGVATTEHPPDKRDALYSLLSATPHPAIILDTFRIGGLLSARHDRQTYRDFFKLDETQIHQLLNGSPIRLHGSHRYRNLPSLLFHETVHWLGFEHSAIQPDITFLYETCCFGGSDYIDDPQLNARFQAGACAALRDRALWQHPEDPKAQAKRWHRKGYDRLKPEMRAAYD
jgi:hypothetical protein